jgi:ribosomal RNA methyltransferase Nop2
MGRRARNKQPPPEPFEPKVFLTSKKPGKRKADSDRGNSRPTKKIKELDGKKSPLKGKKKTVEFLSDEDDNMEGWDDVEDTVDLTTLKKLGN